MTRRRLKIKGWPEQDRLAWEAMVRPGSLLRRGGAFAHLRASTLWSREQSYGHWLAYCQQQGVDLQATDTVGRASADLIDGWAEDMADLCWTTRNTRLVGLRMVLEGIMPDTPQDLLRALCREAEWHANRQVRKGKIGRVLPTGQIVQAGLQHLTAVEDIRFQDATRFRDGLIVASLAFFALRIGNFRDLEIGRSFLIRPGGFDISLSGAETKNHRALEKEVPDFLIPPLQHYLDVYRPILLAKSATPHDLLWVNDWGNRYSHSSLGARISRLTKKMLGVAISPHLMRDAATTTIARLAPSKSRAIAGILGHATLRTADRHYNQARCLDASRAYAPYIEELVEGASAKHSARNRRRENNR